ncbi:MAG: aminomethyl-transferring glycine dehydrogenase [Bdellovibrionaceae bacterium]|nr:aminomethyl-transferring glycine dehydrogenase [Pseudobdellovibrionaceae bacterium]
MQSNDVSLKYSANSTHQEFMGRHIGPRDEDIQAMLKELGFSSLEEMANQVVPQKIRTTKSYSIVGEGVSEYELLANLKKIVSKNKVFRSLLGLGFNDTITPTVIQRNILENPVWYTAYTPYQAEIAQGRLEALLNFQTMVIELTGMEISNSSLLDEGSAAAEAMAMAHALHKNDGVETFVVSPKMHPHVIEVLKTRSEPLGFKMLLQDPHTFDFKTPVFAVFVQYPDTEGVIQDHQSMTKSAHDAHAMVVASADLLSLTLLTPPGEWGADIVVGNSQRLGVPLGFGGPHAAFLATKDIYKRIMPGRIVGVSVDSHGKPAMRLALQTREQHIRREKATSNICTAQVLLANMASMYGVYHGPQGLKKIAQRINRMTAITAEGLKKLNFKVPATPFFDTLKIETPKAQEIAKAAEALQMNFRVYDNSAVGIALDETCNLQVVNDILQAFNLGQKVAFTAAELDATLQCSWPANFVRTSAYMTHPVFNSHRSEPEITRYIHMLQNKDITLTHSMIPLGSCTMKLNATTELVPVSWPEINKMHPFAPTSQIQGYIELIHDLENKLCDITGFSGVSLQPNSGAQGEYAGLLVIRKYFIDKGESHRNICLIPSSAHGTNPASAVMAGMKVVVVSCDSQGNVEVADLKAKAEAHKNDLAALMITYPSTHGVFEESIQDICQIIHDNGGQVYMDGANLNALVGLCRPAEFGADVSHMNLHKTFAIPHGGGGPGVGPIGVREHLKKYLPTSSLQPEAGPKTGISATTSAPWGSASILPISWSYITMMGAAGLKKASLVAILNANYIAKKLAAHYPVVYKGKEGLVAHECILDLRDIKKTSGIDVSDVAKRLMDYGFHAPTMSWPVVGTLMVEPTESEPKAELDRFIEAMISIREEIQAVESGKLDIKDNPLVNSPHTAESLMKSEWDHKYTREQAAYPVKWLRENKYWPIVGRVDNVYGDRNLVCACPSVDSYK